MNLLSDTIGATVGKVADTISDLFTTDQERLQARNELKALEGTLISQALAYEARLFAAQSDVIQAEARGESWLQRNWRPVTMLTFMSLIAARWMGWTAPGMSESEYLSLYDLMKIGLGGYVVGRSAEKIAPALLRSWQTRQGGS